MGRLEVEDRDLPGSPNWVARFTILEGDPDGQFTIRTDPKTNEGVLSIVKVSGPQLAHTDAPTGVRAPSRQGHIPWAAGTLCLSLGEREWGRAAGRSGSGL